MTILLQSLLADSSLARSGVLWAPCYLCWNVDWLDFDLSERVWLLSQQSCRCFFSGHILPCSIKAFKIQHWIRLLRSFLPQCPVASPGVKAVQQGGSFQVCFSFISLQPKYVVSSAVKFLSSSYSKQLRTMAVVCVLGSLGFFCLIIHVFGEQRCSLMQSTSIPLKLLLKNCVF